MRFCKIIVVVAVLLSFATLPRLSAAEEHVPVTPLQLALFSPVQLYPELSDVNGLRINLLLGRNRNVKGLDIGVADITTGAFAGVQLGALCNINYAAASGIQVAGLWNDVNDADQCIQVAGLANFTGRRAAGFQISGLINMARNQEVEIEALQISTINYTSTFRGVQLGAVNLSTRVTGIQIGAVNYAQEMTGIQIGLLNFIEKSSVFFMPIVNAHF